MVYGYKDVLGSEVCLVQGESGELGRNMFWASNSGVVKGRK